MSLLFMFLKVTLVAELCLIHDSAGEVIFNPGDVLTFLFQPSLMCRFSWATSSGALLTGADRRCPHACTVTAHSVFRIQDSWNHKPLALWSSFPGATRWRMCSWFTLFIAESVSVRGNTCEDEFSGNSSVKVLLEKKNRTRIKHGLYTEENRMQRGVFPTDHGEHLEQHAGR